MQTSTVIAIIAAPILGPAIWWLLMWPGRKASNYLWRKLPEGRLRRVLLRETPGVTPPQTPWDGLR